MLLTAGVRLVHAQQGNDKSHSAGFFIGLGYEGNSIVTTPTGSSSSSESGTGGGLALGYGFTRRWSIYSEISGATINADGGGSYTLAHFDLGARVHFRTGPHVVVPFVQFGLSGRDESENVTTSSGTHTVDASGAGIAFGGGLNAHFTPSFAFSGSLTWSVGNFSTYKVDNEERVRGIGECDQRPTSSWCDLVSGCLTIDVSDGADGLA